MPLSEPEWFQRRFRTIDNESGGSVTGKRSDGTKVADSRYGEFGFRISEDDNLIADFPERGVLCAYDREQELAYVSLDLKTVFLNMTDKEWGDMARQGEDIEALIDFLEASDQLIFLTAFPQIGVSKIDMSGEGGMRTEGMTEDVDFERGFWGKIVIDEATIIYHAVKRGDEFVIGVGEISGSFRTVATISMSHKVDFVKEMSGSDPKRFWRLADKIMLNR